MADGDRYSAFIGLGSNMGDKRGNIEKAISLVDGLDSTAVIKSSSLYKTSPVGPADQDWFVNAVILVETSLPAGGLMDSLLKIEASLGRVRDERWGARTVDLDILFYGDEIVEGEALTVPHKHLHERRFVLEPLRELDEGLVHPVLKKTIAALYDELDTKEEVSILCRAQGSS